MIRTNAVPRPVRTAAAVIGVAGAFALAGCSSQAATTDTGSSDAPATSSTPMSTGSSGSDSSSSSSSGTYKDGTYTAEGSYQTPETVEKITVKVTLADDTITAVDVTGDPQARESQQYQGQFIGGISDEVVGKKIDDIKVSRVAGSSLTSGGFNQAIEEIKTEAKS
ncbi:FMN-binding protein [Microbacterium sp. Clip185]|uniref:FMN-binding protein n=1 Tax=Microbacterium sp. Clip185 TaxID=3025663 RepID=UPI0023660020|nr:FMN-binding protein [Microbacterium sp. Clip185]WDG17071.1 FMN-binding protein [Microbacterium sp. Clip185]